MFSGEELRTGGVYDRLRAKTGLFFVQSQNGENLVDSGRLALKGNDT